MLYTFFDCIVVLLCLAVVLVAFGWVLGVCMAADCLFRVCVILLLLILCVGLVLGFAVVYWLLVTMGVCGVNSVAHILAVGVCCLWCVCFLVYLMSLGGAIAL